MKPTDFDSTRKDVGAARTVFEKLLEWKCERFPMPYEYCRITVGASDETGIGWSAAYERLA